MFVTLKPRRPSIDLIKTKINEITRNDNFVGAVFEPINDGARETLAVALQRDVISQTSAHQLISSRHTGRNYSSTKQFNN